MSVAGREVPRVALRLEEAAQALGVGPDFFRREVKPEVRLVRRGRCQLVPVEELRRWAEENAALTAEDGRGV